MTAYSQQLQANKVAHAAADALESSAMSAISLAFLDYENGILNRQQIRHKLEAIIRSAYRTSAAIASQATTTAAGLPGWTPTPVFNNEYLQSLLSDVRRNLRTYKADPTSQRRALLNVQLSASVAAERGFTDQTVSGYTELKDFGYKLLKIWVADYTTGEPCAVCDSLNGETISVDEHFPSPHGTGKVYINLQGPPRHPRCRCRIVVLIQSLENLFEQIDLQQPGITLATPMLSTKQIQKSTSGIISSVKKVLRSIITGLKK